jgi:NDP-sugar pyrophosphorylase family protein
MTPTAAVILAGGPGTRLGALGTKMPKTMLPVAVLMVLASTDR